MLKRIPHIIFYGYYQSFDYYKIGGLESFYRRLANILSKTGCKVSFIFYGSGIETIHQLTDKIYLRYFSDFQTSLDYLQDEASLVLDNYILKKHRLSYSIFRIKYRQSIKFGHIYTGVPKNIQQKIIFISQKVLPSFNGPTLSLSYTIQTKLLEQGINSDVMLPPLPKEYTLPIKKKTEKLRLTFMGRFDNNKGIHEVITLFQKISKENLGIELSISGYFGHGEVNKEELENLFNSIEKLKIEKQSWEKWSPKIDKHVISLLQKTDILILPYHNLQGTMDPPLLILEGMACGCVILTTNVGSVQEFYGESKFICDKTHFVEQSYEIIKQVSQEKEILKLEQKRVFEKVKILNNNKQSIINHLIDI